MIIGFKKIVYTLSVILILCSQILDSAMAEPKVGVLVPQLRAPFKIIYDSVGSGINTRLSKKASTLTIDKNYKPQDILKWVTKENLDAVITLGSLGRKASTHIPGNVSVVLGGLLSASTSSNNFPSVVLTPDPKALFGLLKSLDDARTTVIVVYNPSKNQWLIDMAKRQAAESGVQLVAYKATSIKEAAIIYDEIFSKKDLEDKALWLLQDRKVVDTKVVLPFILDKAWRKKIVVFSSALSHAKKGVLFSMYPNNELHGKELAALMLENRTNRAKHHGKTYPTYGLQEAINSRTAEHLGLNLSRSELREFDVVFPVSN